MFVCAISILQQKTNASPEGSGIQGSGGGGQEAPPEQSIHSPSDSAHSNQQGEFNTSGPHENSTRLK